MTGNVEKVFIAIKLKDGQTLHYWLDDPTIFPHISVEIKSTEPSNLNIMGLLSDLKFPIK